MSAPNCVCCWDLGQEVKATHMVDDGYGFMEYACGRCSARARFNGFEIKEIEEEE